MKFDIQMPDIAGAVRVEIRTTREEKTWVGYLGLSFEQASDTCLLLGRGGVPYRFATADRETAEKKARDFLQNTYRVVRMVW